ncbi:MAG: hypothetical protein FOGNACKC_01466 [Anaerolineae bacterium]|nr:hypothetical protein [Anaerolineae bacterium]
MVLLYNNTVKKFSLPQLSHLELTLIALVLILTGALLVLGSYILYVDLLRPHAEPLSPRSDIAFATITPPVIRQITLEKAPALPQINGLPADTPAAPATSVPYFSAANEMGKVMVLEYHRIAYPEMRYQRSPDNFRQDIQRLVDNNYYPVNFAELVSGLKNVPPGKKPIVLTFDDSDISQFLVLDNRTVDADSALGILLNFHEKHLDDWPMRGTFFVLGDDTNNYTKIFGQPEWAKQKLQVLVDLGMEVGSHTVNHVDLSQVSAERIEWELAVSQYVIEQSVPGYQVQSLSVPYGGFPWTYDFFKAGSWGDYSYTYTGNAAAWGGPSLSPHDTNFDPYHVPRIEVSDIWMDHWLTYFEQNPNEYYISDGDPNRLTTPQEQPQLAADAPN